MLSLWGWLKRQCNRPTSRCGCVLTRALRASSQTSSAYSPKCLDEVEFSEVSAYLRGLLCGRASPRPQHVTQRHPQEPERDASPSVGCEQKPKEREVRDEQHPTPARQHLRPQSGYAQQWEPHEPAQYPRDEDRAEDGLAERVPGDDRGHGDRTQERRPEEGHGETHRPQPSVPRPLPGAQSYERPHHARLGDG